MALDQVFAAPSVEEFTPLQAHQEQTPGSFFGGRPVLHLHSPDARLKISKQDLESQPSLAELQAGDDTQTNGSIDMGEQQINIEGVDVWVTSRHVILFSQSKSTGVQIAYPSITIHAQEGSAVLLGLNLSDANTPDEDLVFIQLRIIPTTNEIHQPQPRQGQQPQSNGDTVSQAPSQALFNAISDCQELNPDPPEPGDTGFDETAPGATGWITSENMQDFMDENGEFRMPEGLTVIGEDQAGNGLVNGAGRTRTAAEANAEADDDDESKWQRTG